MVTQLQPDVRAYLHGGEVIKRYIRVEEVAHEYGFSVEETEYIAKAASSLYKLSGIRICTANQSGISERTYIYIFRYRRRCQDNQENI